MPITVWYLQDLKDVFIFRKYRLLTRKSESIFCCYWKQKNFMIEKKRSIIPYVIEVMKMKEISIPLYLLQK